MADDQNVVTKTRQVVIDLGFLMTLIGFAWVSAQWKNGLERDVADLRNELEDVSDRQQKYIDRRNEQHEDQEGAIDEEHAARERLCQELAARFNEVVCG